MVILNFQISQGSEATVKVGWNLCYSNIEKFLGNLSVKEFWKSVFICRSCDQFKEGVC